MLSIVLLAGARGRGGKLTQDLKLADAHGAEELTEFSSICWQLNQAEIMLRGIQSCTLALDSK
jgi:hypothetical protein